MNWLARLKELESAPEPTLQNLQKGAFVGFVGSPLGAFQKSAPNDDTRTARLALFTDRGLSMEQAEELADRLAGRDLESDNRRLCVECSHLSGGAGLWRCSQWRLRQHNGPEIPGDLITVILHRCKGFNDRLEVAA
ncbi:MAG: hypothetical protein WA924_11605 [Burkholderiaceae bacterium]